MKSNPILSKLAQMRGQLTRWIMVHGIGRWLWVGLSILGADMLLDRLFKMDFAQRLVMLGLMAAAIGIYFVWKVVKPLFSQASDTALLYEVENKHPELHEALLSSFQLEQADANQTGTSPQLTEMTVRRGHELASKLDFGDALNLGQAKWNYALLLSGLGLAAVLGWGVTSNSFLKTWFNRNVMLQDDQWPQATYLQIAGAVDGKLRVARGADHRQLVLVTDASSVRDVSVTLDVDAPGGRSKIPMRSTGKQEGREHLFTFHNVSSKFRFRALGGDEVTDWVEVELVEPPAVTQLDMKALLPDYTGVATQSLVGSGPHSILRGSRVAIGIETNKQLESAQLRFGEDTIALQGDDSKSKFQVELPESGELRGGEYEFDLVDQSGVRGNRKSKFKLTIKEDKPPKVRANLLGISGEVVPRAMLPTSFRASDEYGLARLAFDCQWKESDQEGAPARSQAVSIAQFGEDGLLKERVRKAEEVAVLDLTPLQLQPGISLKMRIGAKDFFPDKENVGWSQEFLLRVVTEQQLRASLLRREIEQREAFDQAYQKQMVLNTDLQSIALRQRPEGMSEADFKAERESKLISALRTQKAIGTAIDAVASRFEEFLVEIKNNRLDEAENAIAPEQRIETRFDEKIVQPIRTLDAKLISLAARQMDACRIEAGDQERLGQAVAQTDAVHQEILAEMKEILTAMSDSENFQGIINDILEIRKDTERMTEGLKDKEPKDGDIFDDDKIFDK